MANKGGIVMNVCVCVCINSFGSSFSTGNRKPNQADKAFRATNGIMEIECKMLANETLVSSNLPE